MTIYRHAWRRGWSDAPLRAFIDTPHWGLGFVVERAGFVLMLARWDFVFSWPWR